MNTPHTERRARRKRMIAHSHPRLLAESAAAPSAFDPDPCDQCGRCVRVRARVVVGGVTFRTDQIGEEA